MEISPARIVLDLYEMPEKSWCWRDDWATGWDSSYGLLSKFAKLNSVEASALVELFLRSDTGRKSALIRNPDIDLRNADLLDRQRIALITRLDTNVIDRAFTSEVFPKGKSKVAAFLRWCPECMKTGFHAAVHQIDYLSSCPLHGQRIISECPRCHAQQPYRIVRQMFNKAFACSKCGHELADAVYTPTTKALLLKPSELDRIEDVTSLVNYASEVLVLAFELDRNSWRHGHGRFAIAKADLNRDHSQYAGFVTAVVDRLQKGERQQMELPLTNLGVAGRHLPVLLPIGKKQRKATSSKKGIYVQWGRQISNLYSQYTAIRRHFWRHVIKRHQQCCRSASEKIWWRVAGSKTPNFCILAEAFLKWRMYWEGCASPSDLWRPISSVPRGIVTWLDESAPMFHFGWSQEGEEWVSRHCFVLKCLSSFRDLLDSVTKGTRDAILWDRPTFSGAFDAYWAVCGNDTAPFPLEFFTQIRRALAFEAISETYKGSSEHYSWHLKQTALIRH